MNATSAVGHGRALIATTIGGHPMMAAAAIAFLVVSVLVLAYMLYQSKAAAKAADTKSTMVPNWHYGSLDAGKGGSLDRKTSAYHMKPFLAGAGKGYREGMTSDSCGAGETSVSVNYPAHKVPTGAVDKDGNTIWATVPGGTSVECVAQGKAPRLSDAGGVGTLKCDTWGDIAKAEAQALAFVGGLQRDTYGEDAIQNAIDSAYDSGAGLTDEQLSSLMHQGDSDSP